MRRTLLLVALLGLAPARAAEAFPAGPGTTVGLVEDHRAPLVFVEIEFPAGTWSPWGREAHLEEAFEIQRYDPAGTLRARADRAGATVSLDAGDRACRLSASFLKSDLGPALDLIRDLLVNRDFDRHELSRWRKERRIEWQGAQREPLFRGRQAVARTLFAEGDPRRQEFEAPRPVLEDPGRLAAARDVLVRLPGRTIGLAGDLTRDEAERAVAGLLPPVASETPAGLAPALAPVTPAVRREREITVALPRLTQVYFAYGRDSIPYTDPDYPAFLVADHVLGGHFYSRLEVALRHEGGETYGAGTVNLGDVAVGPYGLATFTRAPNAAVAEAKLREVLRTFHAGGITEEERAAAVGYLEGHRALERQSPGQVLRRLLEERTLGLPPGFLDELSDRAGRLSLDEVNRFVARFYDPSQFGMVHVAPEAGETGRP